MIVGVGSWRGLGATTAAVLIAARLAASGEHPWLVEADPAGGVLAARLQLPAAAGTLDRVAFPVRRAVGASRFDEAAAPWNGVRVVGAPGDPFRAWACHHPRLAWAPALRDLDGPVIVDVGRLRGGSAVDAVLQQLDVLLLVSSADLVDLVATGEWTTLHGRTTATDQGLAVDVARILVVDAPIGTAAESATRSMVEYELGDRFAGWLPWSPEAVDLVRRGAPPQDRRLRRQPLIGATDVLVERLRAWAPDGASSAGRPVIAAAHASAVDAGAAP